MPECGAQSVYCRGEDEWWFTCHLDEDHEPGMHDYTLDEGQPPLPETEG